MRQYPRMLKVTKPYPCPAPGDLSRRLFMAGAACAIMTTGATASRAGTAEDYVVSLAKQVMALARSGQGGRALKRKFVRLLTRNANMRAIARFALGKYRRKMPRSMQDEYYRLVIDYIAGLFVYYRKDLGGVDIKVKRTQKRGKWLTVDTNMIYANGKRSPVKWRVYSGGGYRVGDVNIQGIWLSLRMRDKFVSILNRNKGDFNALLGYLRKNAA